MAQVGDKVKEFGSGVLTNGGAIQREQDREAKKERQRLEQEAYEKHAAESTARRNKAREDEAQALIAQAQVRKAADEERQRKAAEKQAQEEVARLKAISDKEAARLARQQDTERRLAEKKAADRAALTQRLEERERQSQAEKLLEDLAQNQTKNDGVDQVNQSAKAIKADEENQETEDLDDEAEEAQEPLLQTVKGEVYVPTSIPSTQEKIAPEAAYDLRELPPTPATLTTQMLSDEAQHVESGKELIDRILRGDAKWDGKSPEGLEELAQTSRSENRFQKIINANRELKTENETLKEKIEKLLDEVHGYRVEGELIGSLLNTPKPASLEETQKEREDRHLNPKRFSVENEAKQEMLRYLNTRQGEIDHAHKSNLFLKYIQDPFYMNVFVNTNESASWWAVIDTIYNAIELPAPDWSKVKVSQYQANPEHQTQPIRARTATLGVPVTSKGQPMDRIAQHLGNMGI